MIVIEAMGYAALGLALAWLTVRLIKPTPKKPAPKE